MGVSEFLNQFLTFLNIFAMAMAVEILFHNRPSLKMSSFQLFQMVTCDNNDFKCTIRGHFADFLTSNTSNLALFIGNYLAL